MLSGTIVKGFARGPTQPNPAAPYGAAGRQQPIGSLSSVRAIIVVHGHAQRLWQRRRASQQLLCTDGKLGLLELFECGRELFASSMAARICARFTRLKKFLAVGTNQLPISSCKACPRALAWTDRDALQIALALHGIDA